MIPTTTDYVRLHFIVILFGLTGIIGKMVSLPAVEMVFYRTLLAAAGMGLFLLITKNKTQVSLRDMTILLLVGFIVSIHWLAFFISGRIANVSVSLVGFATASFWTAFLEPIMNRTQIKPLEIFLGLFVLSGLIIIFLSDFNYSIGMVIAILSGFTCALFAIINANLVKRIDANTITFYQMIGATIATALFFPVYQVTWAAGSNLNLIPQAMDWFWLLVLALLCTVYAYSTAVDLFKRISVFLFQLTLNLEPVYGILLALLVFGESEKMNFHFYTGTFIIFCAVFAYPLIRKRLQPSSPAG